jgi:hypothetical protein
LTQARRRLLDAAASGSRGSKSRFLVAPAEVAVDLARSTTTAPARSTASSGGAQRTKIRVPTRKSTRVVAREDAGQSDVGEVIRIETRRVHCAPGPLMSGATANLSP